MTNPVRVGVCPDFREEGWPSMNRVADALVEHLERDHSGAIAASLVAPPFKRRATRVSSGQIAMNFDRGVNRLWDYPRSVGDLQSAYDVFHVVDHSYSQLVQRLPPSRTVVTCHDLDTFRSLLEPEKEQRSVLFKTMTRHILNGFRRAACVTCDTAAVRDELVGHGVIAHDRIVVVPIGVGDAFSPAADSDADAETSRLVGASSGATQILHVGSTVPRKRIDVLLRIFAGVLHAVPDAHLVRIGGAFTPEQQRLAEELGVARRISVLPTLDDRRLAAAYRRAALVLLPSAREGFGLPVLEAMRCGTPVVASDIPVLREVGGGAAEHCPVDDVDAWVSQSVRLLHERATDPDRWNERRARGRAWASRFSWAAFGDAMTAIYLKLACAA
jgi:glycosyltransferase involved in cell wall biosynthesis